MRVIYDIHSHAHQYSERELEAFLEGDRELRIVAVSEDLSSALRALELERAFPDRIIACVGLHPWNIGREPLHTAQALVALAYKAGARCIGEVGLDRRFLDQHTWHVQLRVFREFVTAAKELGAFLNLHAPDAWSKTLGVLVEEGAERAVFHWYTGPLELVEIMGPRGYYVSINPALRIQEKHAAIARQAPLNYLVFESDGPYEYRGMRLSPAMVRETIAAVARMRGIPAEQLEEASRQNSERLIGSSA
ncbi:MAG: TatD family hydrolase [Acidilobaceae archaeon]|nr:TatD family hydrolase [Acidilobaceae archaeon]